jgi:2,4-dienoyl-CoA reductase-like NADH-dependent reductase (Old Yellow Enzyme family)
MQNKFESLEAALYQRELEEIIKEITPHVDAIRSILTKLNPNDNVKGSVKDEKEIAEIAKWIHELPQFGSGYYSGYYLTVSTPHPAHVPDFISRLIKRRAIEKHLAAVDTIAEVQQMAEELYHQSRQ